VENGAILTAARNLESKPPLKHPRRHSDLPKRGDVANFPLLRQSAQQSVAEIQSGAMVQAQNARFGPRTPNIIHHLAIAAGFTASQSSASAHSRARSVFLPTSAIVPAQCAHRESHRPFPLAGSR